MDGKERRQHPRFEGEFQVDLLNTGDDPSISAFEAIVPGVALDVSKQGMRLQSSYKVPVGSYLSVILYYKGHGSVCLCEVVWRRENLGRFLYGAFIKEWSQLEPTLDAKLVEIAQQEVRAASDSNGDSYQNLATA